MKTKHIEGKVMSIDVLNKRIDNLIAMRAYEEGSSSYTIRYTDSQSQIVVCQIVVTCTGTSVRLLCEPKFTIASGEIREFTLPENLLGLGLMHEGFTAHENVSGKVWMPPDGAPYFRVYNKGTEPVDLSNAPFEFEYDLAVLSIPELTDMRVGCDGTQYDTAGEALREQLKTVVKPIDDSSKSSNTTWSSEKISAEIESAETAFDTKIENAKLFTVTTLKDRDGNEVSAEYSASEILEHFWGGGTVLLNSQNGYAHLLDYDYDLDSEVNTVVFIVDHITNSGATRYQYTIDDNKDITLETIQFTGSGGSGGSGYISAEGVASGDINMDGHAIRNAQSISGRDVGATYDGNDGAYIESADNETDEAGNIVAVVHFLGYHGDESTILRNVAAGTKDDDAVNKGQLDEALRNAYTGGDLDLESDDIVNAENIHAKHIHTSDVSVGSDDAGVHLVDDGNAVLEFYGNAGDEHTILRNIAPGTQSDDAVTKGQLDEALQNLPSGGGGGGYTGGPLDMGGYNITNANQIECISLSLNQTMFVGGDGSIRFLQGSTYAPTILRSIAPGTQQSDAVNKGQLDASVETLREDMDETDSILIDRMDQLETSVGDIETALDNIIAIQNSLIGGEGA